MKKLLFGFALVAMVLAVGCKNGDSWGDVNKRVTEIKLTDGDWVYEYSHSCKYSTAENGGNLGTIDLSKVEGYTEEENEETIKFSVKNGKVTVSSDKGSWSTTYPSSIDKSMIEAYAATRKLIAGDGFEYSSSGSTVKCEYDIPERNLPKDMDVEDFLSDSDWLGYMNNASYVYTNDDGTKYRRYTKQSDDIEYYEVERTLVKQ